NPVTIQALSGRDVAGVNFGNVQSGQLLAAAAPGPGSAATLSRDQVTPVLEEAIARWAAAGADVTALRGVSIRIAALSGNLLGGADDNTITLDANAAGWGWFVDPTPQSDSEFTTPGNQGEQNRIDLLTVLDHELGHLLGFAHQGEGVMQDALAP